jgi:hypothetical protein
MQPLVSSMTPMQPKNKTWDLCAGVVGMQLMHRARTREIISQSLHLSALFPRDEKEKK